MRIGLSQFADFVQLKLRVKLLSAKLIKIGKQIHQKVSQKISQKIGQIEPAGYADDWVIEQGSQKYAHSILWMVLLFCIIFIIWAHFSILDIVTIAPATVIPSSQIQVVQNLEGGIIKKLFVREGQVVHKDQVLVQLEPTRFSAAYEEGLAKQHALELKIARLSAETDRDAFQPAKNFLGIDLIALFKKELALEQALKIKIARLDAEQSGQVFQLPKNLAGKDLELFKEESALYQSRIKQINALQENQALIQKEIDMTVPLVTQGAASEINLLHLKRSFSELQEKIDGFKSDALKQLTDSKADLAALQESNRAYLDRLQRTTIRSPVKGIVKQIKTKTVGGVIQPGMDMIEIVPLNDTLLIEAKVKPADIGFLRPDLPVTVKITAYDYSIYGGLKGIIEQISADSIIDEKDQKQQSYYLIRVRTQKNYLEAFHKPLYIIPGMTATVSILTGHQSVLHYILKPFNKARERALKER